MATGTLPSRILDQLRDLQADDDRGELVLPAFTVPVLAVAVGAPSPAVARALNVLAADGWVTSRRARSGELFYKLTDRHHAAWLSVARGY